MGNQLKKHEEVSKELNGLLTVSLTKDGNFVTSGGLDGGISIWSTKDNRIAGYIKVKNSQQISKICPSPDSQYIVTGSTGGLIRTWSTAEKKIVNSFQKGHQGTIKALAITVDNQYVLSGGVDSDIKVWDFYDGKLLYSCSKAHYGSVTTLTVSPDNKIFLSGGEDGIVRVWDLASGKMITSFKAYDQAVYQITLMADNDHFFTSGQDPSIIYWTISGNKKLLTLSHTSENFILSFFLSPDARFLVSAQGLASPNINVWNISTGQIISSFTPEGIDFSSQYLVKKWFNAYFLASSGNAEFIIGVQRDQTIRVASISKYMPWFIQQSMVLQQPMQLMSGSMIKSGVMNNSVPLSYSKVLKARYKTFTIRRVAFSEQSLYHSVVFALNPELYWSVDEAGKQDLALKMRDVIIDNLKYNYQKLEQKDFDITNGDIEGYLNLLVQNGYWPSDTELKSVSMQFSLGFWVYNNANKIPRIVTFAKKDEKRVLLFVDVKQGVEHFNLITATEIETGREVSIFDLGDAEVDYGAIGAIQAQGQ